MVEQIRHYADLDFTVVATLCSAYRVEYKVYTIVGWADPNYTNPLWQQVNANGFEPTGELGKAATLLSGEVKWDGCSNWNFDEQQRNDLQYHGCNRHDLQKVGDIMAACWDWTAELIRATWSP